MAAPRDLPARKPEPAADAQLPAIGRLVRRGFLFALLSGLLSAGMFWGLNVAATKMGFSEIPLGLIAIVGGLLTGAGLVAPYRKSAAPFDPDHARAHTTYMLVLACTFRLVAAGVGYSLLAVGIEGFDFEPVDFLGIVLAVYGTVQAAHSATKARVPKST